MSLDVAAAALQRMDGVRCCCVTVISARGELLCFLPGVALPVCHSGCLRGHTCGTGCAYIYLTGSEAPVFDLCCVVGSAFPPFLFTLLLPPPSPCLQAKAGQDLWSLFHVLISNHAKGWLLEALLCVCV